MSKKLLDHIVREQADYNKRITALKKKVKVNKDQVKEWEKEIDLLSNEKGELVTARLKIIN